MKKAILSIISVVALSASAMAQIPNAGFESLQQLVHMKYQMDGEQ